MQARKCLKAALSAPPAPSSGGADGRNALLLQIQGGARLRRVGPPPEKAGPGNVVGEAKKPEVWVNMQLFIKPNCALTYVLACIIIYSRHSLIETKAQRRDVKTKIKKIGIKTCFMTEFIH